MDGVAGAVAVPGSALLASQAKAASRAIAGGDIAFLRFLAAAELIEADLWQQYDELGGVNGGNPAYMAALTNIDGEMPTYVHLNNNDEQSHAAFLNAYLKSKGAEPVNLDATGKTSPSSSCCQARTNPAPPTQRTARRTARPTPPTVPGSRQHTPPTPTHTREPTRPSPPSTDRTPLGSMSAPDRCRSGPQVQSRRRGSTEGWGTARTREAQLG
jgi:hypothetical protein